MLDFYIRGEEPGIKFADNLFSMRVLLYFSGKLRGYFYLATILLVAASTSNAATYFSDHLNQTLSKKQAGDFVSVLVFMSDQLNVNQTRALYKLAEVSREESHKTIVEELKSYADIHQTSFKNFLDQGISQRQVKSYQSYWIANAFQVAATKEFIASIKDRNDVEAVIEDLPMQSLYSPAADMTLGSSAGKTASPSLHAIGADQMWHMGYTGAGRLVASFDTGVNGNHPALKSSYRGNNGYSAKESWFDPIFNQTYPHIDPGAGDGGKHGSRVMGVMVGKNDATGDTVGVAFGAQWISAMVIDVVGANYLSAFQWAADPDGDPNTIEDVPDVLNNSWGFKQNNINCLDIFWRPIDNLEALGTVVVFAAGNEGGLGSMTIRNPANRASTIYNTFSVGATDSVGTAICGLSSLGPSDCDSVSIKPELVAPGCNIRSTDGDTVNYGNFSGTSFASPYVAGAVALLRQYNPNASVDTIKAALMKSALERGAVGEDNVYGRGLINIPAALALMPPNNKVNLYIKSVTHPAINAGDQVNVVVTIKNSGVTATSISGQLTNPETGVTINSGSANFGNLIQNGSSSNAGTPYNLTFAPNLANGADVTVDLHLTSNSGSYQKTIALHFTVGSALMKSLYTHTSDSCKFTITNYGTYGLAPNSILSLGGQGFSYPAGGTNDLYQCGLVIGTDSNHVSDGIENLIGSIDEDFAVSPGGNLIAITNGELGDLETVSRFADEHAINPMGITVEQRTASFVGSANSNFVLLEYIVTNSSAQPINGMYVGVFCDWDLPLSAQGSNDRTGFARDLGLGYMWQHNGSRYRGTAVLSPKGVQSYLAINSSLQLYNGVSEKEKYGFLTAGTNDTASITPYDQAYCISTGPFNLAPGQSDTATFAMVASTTLDGLRTVAQKAKVAYRQATPVDDGGTLALPNSFKLLQNYPNPFNPETEISYSLPKGGNVSLTIYNLLGEKVKSLVDRYQGAGEYRVRWDGTDSRSRAVASGVYLYRLKAGDYNDIKKMILLK